MASTLEFQFSSLWSNRNDLLSLNQGLMRSVSVQSNLASDKRSKVADQSLAPSRQMVSDISSVNANPKNGLQSRLECWNNVHPNPLRNSSYTCLSGFVVKHQCPKQTCQSVSTDASKDQKETVIQTKGTNKVLPNSTNHLRVPVNTFCALKGQINVKDKSVQVINPPIKECLVSAKESPSGDIKNAKPILPEFVAELLATASSLILMLDCRTFISYNVNHISGALNVSCADCISRKRLLCGRASVGDMINGGEEAKMKYRQMINDTNVQLLVYDGDTTSLEGLPPAHPLNVVITSLQKSGHHAHFLQGGLEAFHKNYGHLCSQPSESPSRPLLHSPTTNVVDSQVDSAVISQILPSVYIGNERDASNRELLRSLGITHVLNVTAQIPLHFESDDDVIYKRLPATDSGSQNLKQYFEDAVSFIDEATTVKGGKVLVHCQAGVSRSATIVIAYVMSRLSLGMLEAYRYVKARRAIVAPNFNFMGQLLEFETTLGSRLKD